MSDDDQKPDTAKGKENTHFSAILTPYRSLSPKGFLILMGLIGGVSFAGGVFFFMLGAWPVVGFLGLDVLLIYAAFKLSYRSGRMYETVDLIGDDLIVTRVSASGRRESWCFNPYWARLEIEHVHDETVRLVLSCRNTMLEFGHFLIYEEKLDFAEALRNALFEYKGGVRI